MSDKKIAFVTSVKLGLSCMNAIYECGSRISLAITLPDNLAKKKSGRIYLDDFCHKKKISLLKETHINNSAVVDALLRYKIDWLFIIGWSQIAGHKVISTPNLGAIGAHPTLLPQGRGRASIPWAILKNLRETGVTLFKLNNGIDTGPIIKQKIVKISKDETATTLYRKIETAHCDIIREFIPELDQNNFNIFEQDNDLATHWPARRPEDSEIDLKGSVWDAERLIRATTKPYPGAFYFESKKKIIIWKAHVLKKKPINIKFLEFKNGYLILDEYEITN